MRLDVCLNNIMKDISNEVIMIDMLDRYGFDFEYVHPSDMSRAERARVEELFRKTGGTITEATN